MSYRRMLPIRLRILALSMAIGSSCMVYAGPGPGAPDGPGYQPVVYTLQDDSADEAEASDAADDNAPAVGSSDGGESSP